MTQQLKTGTTTCGIVCSDGIVLAADKRATAGYLADKKVLKVRQIAPNMAVTISGSVSDIQLLLKVVKAEIKLKNLHVGRDASTKEVANMLSNMLYHNMRKYPFPGVAGFIIGGYDSEGPHLYGASPDGALTESKEYQVSGSGSLFALGAFETIYKPGINVKEGIEMAKKAINAALQRDIYSGNGIDIITITDKGVKTVLSKEILIGLQ
jgi:proteasome beta subunit